jgi:hypothetical protein
LSNPGDKEPFLKRKSEYANRESFGNDIKRSGSSNWMTTTAHDSDEDGDDKAKIFQGRAAAEQACCFDKMSFGWAYPALK